MYRATRRVKIMDGDEDVFSVYITSSEQIAYLLGAELIPVCIGQNYVIYDVEVTYLSGASTSSQIEINIHQSLVSNGEDITDGVVYSAVLGDRQLLIDTHVRTISNGKIVTNKLVCVLPTVF